MTSPGEVLNGRYRLVRRLGGGTMGTVWEAYDTDLERTVAVKELSRGPSADEDAATRRERVRREAIALAQVEHPVIVTVHDLISVGHGEAPWIVMGYVPGRPLSEIIKDDRHAPLPERKIAAIALAVLEGLRACHTSRPRVYHRDVKPGNIVVGPDGSVHLVDFGIARIAGKVPLTEDRNIVGTPEFLAPETARRRACRAGDGPVGARRDALLRPHRPCAVLRRRPSGRCSRRSSSGIRPSRVTAARWPTWFFRCCGSGRRTGRTPPRSPPSCAVSPASRHRPGSQSYWTGPQPTAEQPGSAWRDERAADPAAG